MKHGSLFSGIGGFDLAAEWAGWENMFHCEWNPFGQKVLKHYWPNAATYEDITKTDFTIWRGRIDILTGGFPCQPYSAAGKRLGKEDERHLWPEMRRIIREVQPRWVVGENVLGLVNWNGGLVFDEVQADLEAEGYEVQPFILPAASVNAPHKRDRVWFVAYSKSAGNRKLKTANKGKQNRFNNNNGKTGPAPDTKEQGLQGGEKHRSIGGIRQNSNEQPTRFIQPNWEKFPTESPFHMRDDGIPKKLAIFVVKEFYDTDSYTSQENRIENLHEVWGRISQEEVWEKVRRLYSLDTKEILFQTMQLYSSGYENKRRLSPFSEEVSKEPMRILRKYKKFASSPQGQELAKQRYGEYSDIMCDLPHEVALAARAYTNSIRKFEAWHRQEAIKAAGNAIVPQVVYQIFKAINEYREKYP